MKDVETVVGAAKAIASRERQEVTRAHLDAVSEIATILLPMTHDGREAVLKSIAALFDCGMSFTLDLSKVKE